MPSIYWAIGPEDGISRHPDVKIGEAAHAVAHLSRGRGTAREGRQDRSRVGDLFRDRIVRGEQEIDRIDDADVADEKNKNKIFQISPSGTRASRGAAGREHIPDPEDEQNEYKERHEERRGKFRELGDAERDAREPEIFRGR